MTNSGKKLSINPVSSSSSSSGSGIDISNNNGEVEKRAYKDDGGRRDKKRSIDNRQPKYASR